MSFVQSGSWGLISGVDVSIAVGGKHFGHAHVCFFVGELEFLLSCK